MQGLTLDQIVVDMKGKAFNAGQAYVAFSREMSQYGLLILNFKVSSSVVSEMEKLVTYNVLPPQPVPNVVFYRQQQCGAAVASPVHSTWCWM